jgi:glutaminyl-peptide cyclotransferase
VKNIFSKIFLASLLASATACGGEQQPAPPSTSVSAPSVNVTVPEFDAEQAYQHIAKQVSFGARVPKTPAHEACLQWIKTTFEGFGAKVEIQTGVMESHLDPRMPIKNIIATYNPEAKKRILLCAHWDTRYMCDQDSGEFKKKPVLGADDGGSGVGVLLEIGRQLQKSPLQNLGVDIVLFDVEDQGEPNGGTDVRKIEMWCLGSQYWSKNNNGYKADFGILLDMVGSRGATFPKEGGSLRYAGIFVDKVWTEAVKLGYSGTFVLGTTKEITDDHVFVNIFAKIPTLDIINLPQNSKSGFGTHWHTHKDDMSIIDKATLKAVGQTVLSVLHKEAAGVF